MKLAPDSFFRRNLAILTTLLAGLTLATSLPAQEKTIIERETITTIREFEREVEERPQETFSAAVVVRNRAQDVLAGRARYLQDQIGGELRDRGLSIIASEDVIDSVGMPETGFGGTSSTDPDAVFYDNTSATRLAQNLNADFLLVASIGSFSQRDRAFDGYGVTTINSEYTLRLSYRIVDRVSGGSVISDNITVREMRRKQEGFEEVDSGLVDDLLARAAIEMADSVASRLPRLRTVEEKPGYVDVYIKAVVDDFKVPDVQRGPSGEYNVTESAFDLSVTNAAVEVNGLMIGNADGETPLTVPPGINRLRISREGYRPVERTVAFTDGQELTVPIMLDERGMARMREVVSMLQGIQNQTKLTDAQVEVLQGYAQFFRQSGMKIDYQVDIDSDEAPESMDIGGSPNMSIFGGGGAVLIEGGDSSMAAPTTPGGPALPGMMSTGAPAQDTDRLLAQVADRYAKAVALCVALIKREDGSVSPTGFGTAWAVGERRFATNAHVVEAAVQFQEAGHDVFLAINRDPRLRFKVTRMWMHPDYGSKDVDFSGRQMFSANHDVAIFETDRSAPVSFPLAPLEELQRIDSGYRIGFLGFPLENLMLDNVDPTSPIATMQTGIVTSISDFFLSDSGYEGNQLIRHNLAATGGASGSPIFNEKGQIIALLNAGNIIINLTVDQLPDGSQQASAQRAPSAALINFAQRVDLLKEIL